MKIEDKLFVAWAILMSAVFIAWIVAHLYRWHLEKKLRKLYDKLGTPPTERICEECQGSGDVEIECEACLGEDCDMCCGEGFDIENCPTCDGLGYFVLDWPICKNEVIAAARNRIVWERRQR